MNHFYYFYKFIKVFENRVSRGTKTKSPTSKFNNKFLGKNTHTSLLKINRFCFFQNRVAMATKK